MGPVRLPADGLHLIAKSLGDAVGASESPHARFVSLTQELRTHNVALTIVTAPMLGVAALDNMMLNVMASFAEFKRDMTASRIAEAALHEALQQVVFNAGTGRIEILFKPCGNVQV